MDELQRPAMRKRIPAVLTVDEASRLLGTTESEGESALLARQACRCKSEHAPPWGREDAGG